jgi:hypothetical protein
MTMSSFQANQQQQQQIEHIHPRLNSYWLWASCCSLLVFSLVSRNTCATFLPDVLAFIRHSSRLTVGAVEAVIVGSFTAGLLLLSNVDKGATVSQAAITMALAVNRVLFYCWVTTTATCSWSEQTSYVGS